MNKRVVTVLFMVSLLQWLEDMDRVTVDNFTWLSMHTCMALHAVNFISHLIFSYSHLIPNDFVKMILCIYRSVPGKCPWALKHNLQFWPAWALTRDINSICLYGSCNSDPLKFGTWALTREWALARDTTVYIWVHV